MATKKNYQIGPQTGVVVRGSAKEDRTGPFRLRCEHGCDVLADNIKDIEALAMVRAAHNAVTGHTLYRQVTLDEDGNEIRPKKD